MTSRIISTMIALVMGAALTSPAQAQVQMPEFTISNIPTIEMEGQDSVFDFEATFAEIKNPVMADILRLQYQINLLDRLIRRQTEIQQIAETYKSIGLPFKQPALPESSCEQLPVNVLCMAFYPNSQRYESLIAERRQEFERDQRRQMESMMMDYDFSFDVEGNGQTVGGGTPSADGSFMPRQRRPQLSTYAWSDIRCLAGQCSALLEDTNDSAIRFRIREGEKLPNEENAEIATISVSGVAITRGDEIIKLRPVGVDSSASRTMERDTSRISSVIADTLGSDALPTGENGVPSVESLGTPEETGAIPAQEVESGGGFDGAAPLLGVTGLF